ncbi:MAG: protein phosphatase 2C domain-containing protein [Proteobacteria bacterium]|nr:protein phosphatase 2C domain-containing protein [Pseudomonadota bacterium]
MEDELFLISAGETDTGRRPANDDCILLDPELGLYAVFDGASARVGGRTAAELAAEAVRSTLAELSARQGLQLRAMGEQVCETAFQAAHRAILAAQASDPNLSGMTTTAVLVLHCGRELVVSHVGDSRAYLYRAPELRLLTRDHSLEHYLRDHPQVRPKVQRPGKTLVRALGLQSQELGASHTRIALELDDVLLLCSDGLTDSVPQWTMREMLVGAQLIGPADVATGMARAALSHGSMDNISVVLLRATDRPVDSPRTVQYDVAALASASHQQPVLLGWLTFLEGARRGEVLALEASTVIGAQPDCRVVLTEDYASGRHAELLRAEHGFVLRDMGSTNGTYVNNVRTERANLIDGDVIRIGRTAMVFKSHRLEP